MHQSKTIITALLALLVLLGGVYVWQKHKSSPASTLLPDQPTAPIPPNDTPIDTSNWKTYRNEKIGIGFEYPSSWGDIVAFEEMGCLDYYGEKIVVPKKTRESCLHISLRASHLPNGFFLATEGDDYTKTEIPRGADWRYRLKVPNKSKDNFCSNNPFLFEETMENCRLFKTAQNITLTKGEIGVPFSNSEKMSVYYLRSPHRIFYDVVISDIYLKELNDPNLENNFKRVIETVQFLH